MIDHKFDIYINKDSKILILGSFPSVKSREDEFYYMHKSNRFYKILGTLYSDNDFLNTNINIKMQALKKHQIALYDVILKCDIKLSDDNTIENVVPIDLKSILKNYPIEKIIVNGNKAKELYLKYFNNIDIKTYFLPSTSARNASYSIDRLLAKWKTILE